MNRINAILRLLFLLQTLVIGACSTVISHEPTSELTRAQAKSILKQTFEEQPENFRPVLAEIGDDAIRLGFSALRQSFWTGDLATIDRRETYYFSNLANLQLVRNKGRLLINLSNREGSVRRWVYFYDQKRGTDFLDAVSRMTRPE